MARIFAFLRNADIGAEPETKSGILFQKGGRMFTADRFVPLVLATILAMSLQACGDSKDLSSTKAAELVMGAMDNGCDRTTVERRFHDYGLKDAHSSEPGYQTVSLFERWLDDHIVKQPAKYAPKMSTRTNGGFILTRTFSYSVDGKQQEIQIDKLATSSGAPNGNRSFDILTYQMTVSFCPHRVSSVNILDVQQREDQAKTAFVTFQMHYTLTPLAQELSNAGYKKFNLPPTRRHVATLRRLDATGWEFAGYD